MSLSVVTIFSNFIPMIVQTPTRSISGTVLPGVTQDRAYSLKYRHKLNERTCEN